MNSIGRSVALFFIALSTLTVVAKGQITNGGFESGDFTGWVTIGTETVNGTFGGQPPLEGSFQAVISAPFKSGTVSQASLETFLELTSGSLSTFNGVSSFQGGSAFKQTFTVQNGDVVQFLWDFLPNGASSIGQNDTGFFTLHLSGSSGSPVLLSDTTSSGGNPTGYHSVTSAPLAAGTYLLGFGLYDVGFNPSDTQDPNLLIDNAQVIVPEPASWALIACGGLLTFLFRRRRLAQDRAIQSA